jgi:hypothetical protein
MATNLARQRDAKAIRRKAVVQAKRKAEISGQGKELAIVLGNSAWSSRSPKASAALIDVAEPFLPRDGDRDALYNHFVIAMMAWNLSLLAPGDRKEKMLGFFDAITTITPDDFDEPRHRLLADFEEMMSALITRKLLLYPLDRRYLVNLEVVVTSDGYSLNVGSELEVAA